MSRGSGRDLQQWPSARALASIRGKVRALTDRRYARLPLEMVVKERLNRVLRGWGSYFRHGNSGQKLDQIDAYVSQRLAILVSTKHGLHGPAGPTDQWSAAGGAIAWRPTESSAMGTPA